MAWSTKARWAFKMKIWEKKRSSEDTATTMEAAKLLMTANRFSCQTPQNRSPTVHHLELISTRRLHQFSGSLHSRQRQAHHPLASLRRALLDPHQVEGKSLYHHRLVTLRRPSLLPSTSWVVVKSHRPRNWRSPQRQARHRTHSRDSLSQRASLLQQVYLASPFSHPRKTVRAPGLEASTLHQQRTAL
jgi:hypothetical protein